MVKIVAVRRSDVMMSVERSFFLLCVLGFILSDGVSGMVFPPFSLLVCVIMLLLCVIRLRFIMF